MDPCVRKRTRPVKITPPQKKAKSLKATSPIAFKDLAHEDVNIPPLSPLPPLLSPINSPPPTNLLPTSDSPPPPIASVDLTEPDSPPTSTRLPNVILISVANDEWNVVERFESILGDMCEDPISASRQFEAAKKCGFDFIKRHPLCRLWKLPRGDYKLCGYCGLTSEAILKPVAGGAKFRCPIPKTMAPPNSCNLILRKGPPSSNHVKGEAMWV